VVLQAPICQSNFPKNNGKCLANDRNYGQHRLENNWNLNGCVCDFKCILKVSSRKSLLRLVAGCNAEKNSEQTFQTKGPKRRPNFLKSIVLLSSEDHR
jgi:hypothetical protein